MLTRFSCVWIFCHPMDCSLLGSSIQAILQARTLEWVAISSPGYLPDPRIKLVFPMSLAWQADSLLTEAPGKHINYLSSVLSLKHAWLFATPWTEAQAFLSITNSQSLLKLMSIKSVMPSNQLILCQPLLLLPSIFPSVRVFSKESVLCIRWPKYWSFSIHPSNEHSGLISFRMNWLALLAVQETLKSLLQHHSSKASILWRSALFTVQHSHPYMTPGKYHSFD